jgi:glycosyltransferase involved in cell wall biosynthesis
MGRMKILQLIPSLDRAGAEKQMGLLAQGLPREQFDVHVCALSRGGPLEVELRRSGVPVTVIGKRWPADPLALWRLQQHVAGLKPDLIHAWMFAANAYGYAAARACGVPHVIVAHRCADPWKSWSQLALDRWLAGKCDRVVANSPGVQDFYVGHGLPAEKISVIPNGALPAPASGTTRGQLLAELGLPEKSRLIGLVGRLWPQKRVKDAIWAADLLKVIRDDVHLLVIGDGPHRDRLRRFQQQVVIADKVHFLGDRGDVPRWMPHFDVFWSTSAYEGQSNAIMEAMAAGVPVVASDIPGTRDLVAPGVTGYLVKVGHRAGFARWTNQLLDDADLRRRLGQSGRERIGHEFSVEQMVSRYVELYGEVLGH